MNTNAAGGFPHVILASASPRRLDLLRQAGIEPEVEPSHVVEVIRSTKPDEVVMELSRQKAEDIASRHTGEDVVVIGADTVVAFDGNILGKPKDEADAVRMIASFQANKERRPFGFLRGFLRRLCGGFSGFFRYRIGLASSKPEKSCERILEHFGILDMFDEVVGATFDGRPSTHRFYNPCCPFWQLSLYLPQQTNHVPRLRYSLQYPELR